ncbi:MAG: right-handed parallel beta-helix repeat-containing protein [Polyangiaceae bacterium]|nr:right-handed parallel beta-helix repeat-containing protein [Polyangiaceae bacterium]
MTSLGFTLASLATAANAQAQAAAVAGEVSTPYPTFENLSIEWELAGDVNANSVVSVRYRAEGDEEYREGHPLFLVPAGANAGFSWTEKHSGSLFGLTPGTTYEIELSLDDPDGGSVVETIIAVTRPIPTEAPDARFIDVTPGTIDDALADAVAGDVLVLGGGTYASIRATNDGEEGRPIVLRAAVPGDVVVEGEVRLDERSFVSVEGLTVHGRFKFNDAEGIVVRDCAIEAEEYGIASYGSGVRNAYIVNNVITGPTIWRDSALGVSGDNLGEGVQITGSGNVIAFNRVSGFRDCISLLEEDEAVDQVSIDIYGNDLDACADDGIEADYAMGNVRIYQNRITRSFMGISSQPSLGGPTWFIRNVLYDVIYEAFKLHNGSVGDVGYHNTVVKSGDAFAVYTEDAISRAHFRNNLFLGGPGGTYGGYDSGEGAVLNLRSADPSCSFDYDGFGSIGTDTFAGRIGDDRFDSLQALRYGTTEVHAIDVDLSVFEDSIPFPSDPFVSRAVYDFGLAAQSSAIDHGVVLPNVNDFVTGAAPDLGAFERGAEATVYGPDGFIPGTGSGGGGSGGAASGTGGRNTGGSSGGSTPMTGGGEGGGDSGGSGGVPLGAGGRDTGGSGGAPGTGGNEGGGGSGAATAETGGDDGDGGSGARGTGATSGTGGNDVGGGAPGGDGPVTEPDGVATDHDDNGGCGCVAVGREPERGRSAVLAIALAGLALAGARRRRRPTGLGT